MRYTLFNACCGLAILVALGACSAAPDRSHLVLTATNPLNVDRPGEVVEVPWSVVADRLDVPDPRRLLVAITGDAEPFLSQAVDADADGTPELLLFQADFAPGQTRAFDLSVIDWDPLPETSLVFGRAVPERLDDFAWENDRIAFRVYGPALEPANDAGSGIDVWVKSVRHPIINKWYAGEDYHTDHGEGLDYYKVGKSRGAGGLGVFVDGTLHSSRHYTEARVLANGPIRVLFELDYAPWDTPLGKVSETKRIALDLGSNLNRIESMFSIDGDVDVLPIAVGLAMRDGDGKTDHGSRWIGYWEPAQGGNGHTGVAAILPSPNHAMEPLIRNQTDTTGVGDAARPETNTHYLAVTSLRPDEPLAYYAGAGWSKSGDFDDADAWFAYVEQATERIAVPIRVELKY